MTKAMRQARGWGRAVASLLVVAVVLMLSGTGKASREIGARSFVLSKRPAPAGIRASLQLQEPSNLEKTERVRYHVLASSARVTALNSRYRGVSSKNDWTSNVISTSGSYSMSIQLGTPPQNFSLVADTGSDLVWVQAKKCTTCFNQTDRPYDPTASSTYSPMTCASTMCSNLGTNSLCSASTGNCKYTYEYGDLSSTNGSLASETVTLTSTDGSLHQIPNFTFGVGLQNSQSFSVADGLVGLGQGKLSFLSQLGATFGNIFSYCLVNWTDSANQSSPIIFGTASVPKGNVQYTPLQTAENVQIPTLWFLQLNSVSAAGQTIPINFKKHHGHIEKHSIPTIIDSGTTVTYLKSSTYASLARALESAFTYPKVYGGNSGFDHCYNTSADPYPTFPGATFHFQGGDWVLPQGNTFINVDNEGTWCLAMVPSDYEFQVFGNVQQQNFHVVYDQPHSRLGWVAAECDSL